MSEKNDAIKMFKKSNKNVPHIPLQLANANVDGGGADVAMEKSVLSLDEDQDLPPC